jgi:hypothetical protein
MVSGADTVGAALDRRSRRAARTIRYVPRLRSCRRFLVDVFPVLEGVLKHFFGDPVTQVRGDVGHHPATLGVVHHVADECAGLAPVVVRGAQRRVENAWSRGVSAD